ncbi:DegT/DnrJ/EryC1/StrS family aminotransferase [Scytonema sp. NUACC26]|uniref:DegT/DnrJ/EryC1/StrS family aminotransferase n=1 Tax=Scytonema sp. NUACC26 TaxID=3140176 RepID=UPI0034DCABFA
MIKPILLSTPHMGDRELEFVKEAFDTNWIAPVGPQIDAFEQEFCQANGARHAAAVSSGTAALHLALRLVGVESGDEVFCSTLTFIATANPITYLGAKPVFIDSDLTTWNMNPDLLWEALERRSRRGKLPKAVVLVHLYGQSADIDPILEICDRYEIPLIEDAAESLGATYKGRATGTFGRIGIYSFNGNKIITTSGGGMLVSDDERLVTEARFLATQARDLAPHYQHSEIGYNYRLSNILAGIGRGQLRVLNDRVAARRRNYEIYAAALGKLPGIEFMPEANFGSATRWLTCLTIDPEAFGADREQVRLALAKQQIETRPVWKPLHLQPVFTKCKCIDGAIAEYLFTRGLCLPSGSNLTIEDLERVIDAIESVYKSHSPIFSSQSEPVSRSQAEPGNAHLEAPPRQLLLNGGGAS